MAAAREIVCLTKPDAELMKHLKFGITVASIPIALLSSPVFAAQDCSAYCPHGARRQCIPESTTISSIYYSGG